MGINSQGSDHQAMPREQAKGLPYPRIPEASPTYSGEVEHLRDRSSKYLRCSIFLVVGIIFACAVFFAAIVIGTLLFVKESGAFQLAMEIAQENKTVKDVLGSPIQSGLFTTGSVSDSGSGGSADLRIPLSGPRQSGILIVTAIKEEGEWRITTMVLDAGGKQYPILP